MPEEGPGRSKAVSEETARWLKLCSLVIRRTIRKDSLSEADGSRYEQKIRDSKRQRIDDGGDMGLRPVHQKQKGT